MEDIKINSNKTKSLKQKSREQKIFYWTVLALPLIHFIIFYLIVNFRSILFSFQLFDTETEAYIGFGFQNFKQVFYDLVNLKNLSVSVTNSLLLYACGLVMGTGLGLLFSFYIYKKFFAAEFFRVMLFLPQIISAVVLSIIYKYIIDSAVPFIWSKLFNIQVNGLILGEKGFTFVLAFTLWIGFGTSVLMYTSSMSGISESIVESAELDGVNPIKEFWYITLPMIYPTLVTFLTVGIAGIFTNQMNLYSFYGIYANENHYTFGYFLYKSVQLATKADYPYLSAIGLLMTVVAVPVTLLIKHVLEKYGPSAE